MGETSSLHDIPENLLVSVWISEWGETEAAVRELGRSGWWLPLSTVEELRFEDFSSHGPRKGVMPSQNSKLWWLIQGHPTSPATQVVAAAQCLSVANLQHHLPPGNHGVISRGADWNFSYFVAPFGIQVMRIDVISKGSGVFDAHPPITYPQSRIGFVMREVLSPPGH